MVMAVPTGMLQGIKLMIEKYYYSATTKGFYLLSIKNSYDESKNGWPADCVEINENYYRALLNGQSDGKNIVPDENGTPVLEQ